MTQVACTSALWHWLTSHLQNRQLKMLLPSLYRSSILSVHENSSIPLSKTSFSLTSFSLAYQGWNGKYLSSEGTVSFSFVNWQNEPVSLLDVSCGFLPCFLLDVSCGIYARGDLISPVVSYHLCQWGHSQELCQYIFHVACIERCLCLAPGLRQCI